MEQNLSSSSRTDRKLMEKNRRNQMKALYSQLNSLVPHESSREPALSVPDQLDEAVSYIKRMQTRLEKMKEKRDSLMGMERANYTSKNSCSGAITGIRSPRIKVREMGSTLEIVLMNGSNSLFMFNEIIRALHDEGAEIINASLSAVEDTVFHTIHSKVGDSAHGMNTAARISQKLKMFVEDDDKNNVGEERKIHLISTSREQVVVGEDFDNQDQACVNFVPFCVE